MNEIECVARGGTALGALLLAAAGSAIAASADDQVDDGQRVDVNVAVTDRYPSGVLAMSVAADETALTEINSGDPLVREFTGTLPTVTVTDTRSRCRTCRGTCWERRATSSAAPTASPPTISGGHRRSPPTTVTRSHPGETSRPWSTTPDSAGLGYPDGELLYVNSDQLESYHAGSWSASAGLDLKVARGGRPAGNYTSVITLSLFE